MMTRESFNIFFFSSRRRHTRFDCDWSSDVCSSDLREEGLENAWARATRHHLALKAGLEAMGMKMLVAEKSQLPQMNAVRCPEGVNEAEVRKRLLNEFSIEIGAGLGPLAGKIWRIGLMGYSCRPDNVMLCLSALGSVLSDMGMAVHVGDAEAAIPMSE